jgi:hypothetical protein
MEKEKKKKYRKAGGKVGKGNTENIKADRKEIEKASWERKEIRRRRRSEEPGGRAAGGERRRKRIRRKGEK